MNKIIRYLAGLILIGCIIFPRFYDLGGRPPGLHIDEVSFGMEAKMLADTGRDTWGKFWPIYFKGFGEYKAPGLVYATIPFIKLNGGNISTSITRMPSAFMGIMALVFCYLIIGLLWPNSSIFTKLLVTSILTFSPWHFGSSRVYFETSGGSAWMFIAMYFILKNYFRPNNLIENKNWLYGVIAMVIAGYWYASFRYIGLLMLVIAWLLNPSIWAVKKKMGLTALFIIVILGFGWIKEIGSSKGLSRLYQFNQEKDFGSSLIANDKRGLCYLSLDKNPTYTKLCYLLWNKPVLQIMGTTTYLAQYLSPTYLFMDSGGEYGVDGGYGTYLFPVLIPYVIGLLYVIWGFSQAIYDFFKVKKSKIKSENLGYAAIFLWLIVSFIPAAYTLSLNIHRSVVGLYLVMIVIIIGVREITNFLRKLHPLINILFWSAFSLITSFYIIQSLTNYFLVFTHSNDTMWTSDTEAIYRFVIDHANEYDHIVDTDLHGPLAASFYGGLTSQEILATGKHSAPDANGWTYLISAGKFELRHINVVDLACEKLGTHDSRKILAITESNPGLSALSKYSARSWSGEQLMHEIYDLDDIIAYESRTNSSFTQTCTSK